MSSQLMNTEPGGETSQYESIKTVTEPHSKATGQFKDSKGPTDADTQQAEDKRARGELTAENIRYGEAISEHGMGGETMAGGIGVASQDGGVGRVAEEKADVDAKQSRKSQGYGEGSGVGA